MDPGTTLITLISIGLFGFGLKYVFKKCDDEDDTQFLFYLENSREISPEEIPPLYENVSPMYKYTKPPSYNQSFENNNDNQVYDGS